MRLHHVQVVGPPGCEARMRQFYGDLLGLAEVAKPPGLAGRGGVWFRGPAYELHVSPDDGFVAAHRAHPAFCLDHAADLDALADRIAAAGHEVTYDSDFIGYRRFHTFDPYGNRVEIMQALR